MFIASAPDIIIALKMISFYKTDVIFKSVTWIKNKRMKVSLI